MGQLKLLTPQSPTSQPRATPQDFGAQEAQALTQLGQQLTATTNSVVQNALRPMARAEAASYGKELTLELRQVTENPGSFQQWETDFEGRRARLRAKYARQSPFGSSRTFNDAASLYEADNKLSLQTTLTQTAVRAGKAAYEQEHHHLADEFFASIEANDPEETAQRVADLDAIVASAVEDGLVFSEGRELEHADRMSALFTGAAERYIATGRAGKAIELLTNGLLTKDGERLPISPELTAQSLDRAYRALESEQTANTALATARKTEYDRSVRVRQDQFRVDIISQIMTGKDSSGKEEISLGDIQKSLKDATQQVLIMGDGYPNDQPLLTPENYSSLLDILKNQGVGIIGDPKVEITLRRLVAGAALGADMGLMEESEEIVGQSVNGLSVTEFETFVLQLAAANRIDIGRVNTLLDSFTDNRFKLQTSALARIVEDAFLGAPEATLQAQAAAADFDKWMQSAEGLEADNAAAQTKFLEIIEKFDLKKLFGSRTRQAQSTFQPPPNPGFDYVVSEDGTVDVRASRNALYEANKRHNYPAGYMKAVLNYLNTLETGNVSPQ